LSARSQMAARFAMNLDKITPLGKE
jgi:hypothetical protein